MKKIYKYRVPQTVFIKQSGIEGTVRARFLSEDEVPIYDVEVSGEVVEYLERELSFRRQINNLSEHQGSVISKGTFLGKTEDGYSRYAVNQAALDLSNPVPQVRAKAEKPFQRITIANAPKATVIAAYHDAKKATKPF